MLKSVKIGTINIFLPLKYYLYLYNKTLTIFGYKWNWKPFNWSVGQIFTLHAYIQDHDWRKYAAKWTPTHSKGLHILNHLYFSGSLFPREYDLFYLRIFFVGARQFSLEEKKYVPHEKSCDFFTASLTLFHKLII